MFSRLLLFISLLVFTKIVYGQVPPKYISFIKERPDQNSFQSKDSTLAYPIFHLKEEYLSRSINNKLKADFSSFYELKSTSSIRSLLKSAAQNGLVALDYNGVRNDDKIISFYLSFEGVGAYSSYWEMNYAFNKKTGQSLTLDSLIKKSKWNQFIELLQRMQKDNIEAYKKEMLLEYKNGNLSKEDYEYIEEHTQDYCWKYFKTTEFKLYQEYIEVIIDCEFPHVIMALSPPSVLTIPIQQYEEYFRPFFIE